MASNWLAELLCSAANEAAGRSGSRAIAWERIGTGDLRRVLDAGLGPWLHRAAATHAAPLSDAQRETLLAADLSAQVLHGKRVEVALEVVDLCRALDVEVTLLKGIALAEWLYPAAHLRPMADVDLLVAAGHLEAIQRALLDRGYVASRSEGAWVTGHHAQPLRHPALPVWVELHRGLFPAASEWNATRLFAPEALAARSIPFAFHGRATRRLGDSLQLAYTASYWVRDLARHAPHPSFAAPLFDAALLLARCGRSLDLEALLDGIDDALAVTSLHVMLSFLARHGLVADRDIDLDAVARRQSRVGAVDLRLLHAFLDAYLLQGRQLPGAWRAPAIWSTLIAPGHVAAKVLSLPVRFAFPPQVAG